MTAPPRLDPQRVAAATLTSAEVAAIFGVNVAAVNRWARNGWLTAARTPGGRLRFGVDQVAYLRAASVTGRRP